MRIRVLGSAAGGAFPQWNCSCRNCRGLRDGTLRAQPRSQAQLAISANSSDWFLIQASPDLRAQIESFPPLHPAVSATSPSPLRQSPIHGVVLTSAEVDAALGLLLLRESQPIAVYATRGVRELLTKDNAIFNVLRRQADQVTWKTIVPGEAFPLHSEPSEFRSSELRSGEFTSGEAMPGQTSGLSCLPISTGAGYPSFVPGARAAAPDVNLDLKPDVNLDLKPDVKPEVKLALKLDQCDAVLGLLLRHRTPSRTVQVAFFPGAASISPDWLPHLKACDAIFFDGTFWTDDELIRIQGSGKTARQMGHLPLGEPGGTLDQFASILGPRKILIHINNTNPVLDEDSPEHRRTLDAGWELAYDGMELEF